MKNIILTLVITLAIHFTNMVAQENNESVSNLVSTLKQKVLLNDDQTTSIEKVLTELVNKSQTVEDNSSLIQDAQKKVESFLDRKQKMKYDIIKNEWWKQVSALL